MMDMGGAEEEDLVAAVKVDSTSLAEGTWTCPDSSQAGQVVLCWDNSFSLLRSKTIAYRTWVVKNDSKAPTAKVTATAAAPLAPSPMEEEEVEVIGHTAADQDAAKVAEQEAAAKRRQETALAAEREAAAAEAAKEARVAAEKAAAEKAAEARAAAEAEAEAKLAVAKAAADKAAAVEAEAAAAAAAAASAEEQAKAEEVLRCLLCLVCTCVRGCVRVASSAGESELKRLGCV